MNQTTPLMPNQTHLLSVANDLCLSTRADVQAAKDCLTRISFNHNLSGHCTKEECEMLFCMWLLLDRIGNKLHHEEFKTQDN
jgi:hypothetical protein